MRTYKKRNFPVAKIRRFMEPGPIVLVSAAWKNETNIMTMGWHMMMEFEVIKSHVATHPFNPKTIHYRGEGEFMVAGKSLNLRRLFKPEML